MTTRYVNTNSTAGGDGTTNNTSGATRAYATLSEAETGEAASLSAPLEILCTGGADSGATRFTGGWTTSATNTVTVKPNTGEKHAGAIDTGKYHKTSAGAWQISLRASISNFFIEGMQGKLTHSNSTMYRIENADSQVTASICKGDSSGGQTGIYMTGSGTSQMTVANNLIYDCAGYGIRKVTFLSNITYALYNNTVDNCGTGLSFASGFKAATRIYNNLLTNSTTDYSLSGSLTNHDNNVTSDATGPDSAHVSKTVTYDAGADVFTTTDTDIVDLGTDLDSDSLYAVTVDIIDVSRHATTPDIGCFESAGGGGGATNPHAPFLHPFAGPFAGPLG